MSGPLLLPEGCTSHKGLPWVLKLAGAGSTSRLPRVAKEVFPDLFLRSAGITHINNQPPTRMVPFERGLFQYTQCRTRNTTVISCSQEVKYCDVSYCPEAGSNPTLLCPPHLKACARSRGNPQHPERNSLKLQAILSTLPMPLANESATASSPPPPPPAHLWMDTNEFPSSWPWGIKPGVRILRQLTPTAPSGSAHPDLLLSRPPRSSHTFIAVFNE